MKPIKEHKMSKTGSVRIEPDVLHKVKEFCKSRGILVSFFLTEAAKEKMQKEKSK